jgi:hypothetical protein
MAKAKSSKKKSARAKKAATGKPSAKRHSDLAGFFKKLYSRPAMMDAWAAGGDSRQKVIAKAKLSPEHQQLIASGCVPDILRELSGAPRTAKFAQSSVVVESEMGTLTCTHAACKAFNGQS